MNNAAKDEKLSSRAINIAICRALNVDPARVIKLVLTIEPDRLPRIEITRLHLEDARAFSEAVEHFYLSPEAPAP